MTGFLKRKIRNLTSDRRFSEIFRGTVLVLTARVAATGLTLLATIIVARVYGAEATGVLAMVNAFLMLVTIFTVLGTGTSILRLIPEHCAKYSVSSAFQVYRKTQYFVAAVSAVTGILFYFTSGVVADKVFNKPHLSFFFALAAGFVIFKSLMDLNTQAVRGLRLIRTFAFMQVMPSLTMLLILVAATLLLRNQSNPVYAQLAAFGLTAVAGAWIMDRAFKRRMQGTDTVHEMPASEILSLSLPMLMTASLQFFIGQMGVVMLGMFRSETEVGYYSVAVRLATLTAFVLAAINSLVAPKFSEFYHTGKLDELFYLARKSAKLIFWATGPILLFLVVFGHPLLALFFGKDFTIAYQAMSLLVIGQFVNAVSGPVGYFMNMTGHQKILRNILLCSALLNVTLNLVLIPRYGINGAAFTGMISMSFSNIFTVAYIRNKFGVTIAYFPMLRL